MARSSLAIVCLVGSLGCAITPRPPEPSPSLEVVRPRTLASLADAGVPEDAEADPVDAPMALQRVVVRPARLEATVGTRTPVEVIAILGGGLEEDASERASWVSFDERIATVVDGRVRALRIGATTLRATVDGVGASLEVHVMPEPVEPPEPPRLTSIGLSPSTVAMVVGASVSLAATSHWSDGAERPLDASAVWTCDAQLACGAGGRVTAMRAGEARVTVSWEGMAASAEVTVLAPITTAIEVAPSTLSLRSGERGTFVVTAVRSDGARVDATARARVRVRDAEVATLVSAGVVAGRASGSTRLFVEVDEQLATLDVVVR